jgi:MFS family permease
VFRAALTGGPARRFFAAHAQSCLGTGLAYVALPLLAYERFGTAWAVTAVLLPELLPAVVLGPLLGAVVDRVGWRACLVAADVLRALAFGLVLVSGSMGAMVGAAALGGIGTALFAPAALAGVPRLVEDRGAGMGLFGALDDLGYTVGPALAAGLLALWSPGLLVGVNAVTFALSAVLVAGVGREAVIRERKLDAPRGRSSLWGDVREGLREVGGRREVRTLLASSASVVLCIGVVNVAEVVLAREVLGVGGSGLALLVMAGGLGTVAGSLCTRFTGAGTWVWRRAYVLGVACMVLDLLITSAAAHFWLVLAAFTLGGFGNGLALVHDRMLLSASTPEALHGRLFALQKTCTSLAFAVSFLAGGALIALAGVQTTLLVAGLALAAVTAVLTPRLRAAWPAPSPTPATALGDALA